MSKTKTYWKGYSEKHQTPEFSISSQKEFQDDVPVDEFLGSDGIDDLKTGRRDFLKFMGFSVAAATLASCESPVIKSIPYVNKPEEITPGVSNWYSSAYYDGNDFANVLVKSREGRPIWLKGKRESFTQGGLIPRVSTSILNLYIYISNNFATYKKIIIVLLFMKTNCKLFCYGVISDIFLQLSGNELIANIIVSITPY